LAYSWNAQKSSLLGLNGLETYLYINNLGILWKASKVLPDPDFQTVQNLRSIAVGLRASF